MSVDFPIPIIDPLPTRIENCPIVEAVMEIRFVTNEQWRNLPGLLYPHIRDRYSEQKDLPLSELPDAIRRQQPHLSHLPLMQFLSDEFVIQFGPQVIGLVTKPKAYPGWVQFSKEMHWLLDRLKRAAFVDESVRVGVRYVDFFGDNLFPHLVIKTTVVEQSLELTELSVNVILKKDGFTARLQIANSAIIQEEAQAKIGSILDLDVWLPATDIDIFNNGMEHFNAAHTLVKQIFFGLLKSDFLTTLKPEYP